MVPLSLLGEAARRLTTRVANRSVVTAVARTAVPLHLGVLVAIAGGTAVALVTMEPAR